MPNELDELNPVINENGLDANVINKQIPIKVGAGSTIFEIFLWCTLVGGFIFLGQKIKAERELSQLQQKIQHDASQIDNYLEQRVVILTNLASLIEKEMAFEKSTLESVTAYRSGINPNSMNEANAAIENVERQIKAVFERYPDLKSQSGIEKAMKDNDYLQREITAAREVYNDSIMRWNEMVYRWPSYKIVAAKKGYTTRIPFTTSKEIKEKARSNFFE